MTVDAEGDDAHRLVEDLAAANAEHARGAVGRLSLHAAAISRSAGVIALAGRSRSGKSTLAAAAVRAGYGYVADEITAVSPDDLSVLPYHRPIGLRRGGAAAIGVDYPDSERYEIVYPWDVGDGAVLSAGGRLRAIVLVSWGQDSAAELVDVRAAQAMAELTEHAVVDDENYRPAFDRLQLIVRAVPVVRMRYATTQESLALLAALVDELPPDD